jgi:hypothetical protein
LSAVSLHLPRWYGALVALVLAAPAGAAASAPIPTPIGATPAFHPGAASRAVAGFRCTSAATPRTQAHLELFARRLVVIVPAGIGTGRSCSYPARTREPTGVIDVSLGRRLTLGDFFAIWGQPLSRTRLVGFRAAGADRVRAFVGGREWPGDPRSIPLARHAEIVLEIGGYVPPHTRYLFPVGMP